MEPELPATQDETALTLDATHDLHSDHGDPQHQEVQQNLVAVLLPMAIIAFLVVSFVAAAWTFLAALPAG
ncbi:MAG: hypothetical protein ABIQ05_07230 [Candidatus Limnocylindria bacterium]